MIALAQRVLCRCGRKAPLVSAAIAVLVCRRNYTIQFRPRSYVIYSRSCGGGFLRDSSRKTGAFARFTRVLRPRCDREARPQSPFVAGAIYSVISDRMERRHFHPGNGKRTLMNFERSRQTLADCSTRARQQTFTLHRCAGNII